MPPQPNLPYGKINLYFCPQTALSMDEEQATPLGHLPAPRFSQLYLRSGFVLSSHETSCTEPSWALSSQTLKNPRARAEGWTVMRFACHRRNSRAGWTSGQGCGRGEPGLRLGKAGVGSSRKTCGELDPELCSNACLKAGGAEG